MTDETEASVNERDEAVPDEARTEDPPAEAAQVEGSPAEESQADDAQAADAQAAGEIPDVPITDLRPSLEAVLMVADQPLDQVTLASAVGHPVGEVRAALDDLAREYAEQGRGFELRNVAGGWRYYTREEHAAVVEAFVLDGQQARLTQAALETLAVVAYKQPVSRARVSAIRGVNVDGVMRTLLTRGLVEEAGQDGETGANLYRTTSYFLERIGITAITDLPELAPFLPDMDDMEDDLAALAGGPDPAGAAEAVAAAPIDPATELDPEPVVEVEMAELGLGADAVGEDATEGETETEHSPEDDAEIRVDVEADTEGEPSGNADTEGAILPETVEETPDE